MTTNFILWGDTCVNNTLSVIFLFIARESLSIVMSDSFESHSLILSGLGLHFHASKSYQPGSQNPHDGSKRSCMHRGMHNCCWCPTYNGLPLSLATCELHTGIFTLFKQVWTTPHVMYIMLSLSSHIYNSNHIMCCMVTCEERH